MTTTTYRTTADVPPSAWAALVADMQRLLTVLEVDGTVVTGPTGDGAAQLTDQQIGFIATAPGLPPLTVEFARAAGEGTTTTSHPATTGLTLAAMARAARHWGQLFTWTSDADLTARAIADTLGEGLFGEEDYALAGSTPLPVDARVRQLLAQATAAAEGSTTVLAYLDVVIGALTAIRAGIAAGTQLLGPGPAHAQDEPTPTPAKRAPAKRASRTRKATP